MDITKVEEREVGKKSRKRSDGCKNWWKEYYVYVISSLLILITVAVTMMLKHYWPFGDMVLLDGDYILQTWPFVADLQEKVRSGESILYTWGAGLGTNLYSILAYGLLSPATLLYLIVPVRYLLRLGTIVFVLSLILMNISMLYFLTHRPGIRLAQNNIANMLFSLSYACCMYNVANANNWTFLTCAVMFPLIILGLENYVAGKGYKIYAVSLLLAFIFNFYFAALFCVYIILYYFTLEFDGFRDFLKKSVKLLGISALSVLVSSGILLPAAIQMRGQSYTTSSYQNTVWYTGFFDIIKNFFVFNKNKSMGTSATSYGEVNLYFGLLVLMFTTLFFLNGKIRRGIRIKKLILVVVYILAFNLNGLNYIMHLFHYPSWYPNRFSLFFILLCITLAYEAWGIMEQEIYQNISVIKTVLVGIGWTAITIACFAFAKTIDYQFTYYYSMMIFLFYMVAILILQVAKKTWARILVGIGCLELCLNFIFALIFKVASVEETSLLAQLDTETTVLENAELPEHAGFSRINTGQDILQGLNSGMMFGYNGTGIFSSSIGNAGNFLKMTGIYGGGNVVRPYTYNQALASMMGIQYQITDDGCVPRMYPNQLYSQCENLYGGYEIIEETDGIRIYENPTVLSLGYMIPDAAKSSAANMSVQTQSADRMNILLQEMTGVEDVLEPADIAVEKLRSVNCYAVLDGNDFYMASDQHIFDTNIGDLPKDGILTAQSETEEYLSNEISLIRLDYKAPEDGNYYACVGDLVANLGAVKKGDLLNVFFSPSEMVSGDAWTFRSQIRIYRFDDEKWQQAYEKLASQQLEVTGYTSTSVDGTIDVTEDGIMFTSIPYDKNWHLYVDGKETEIEPLWSRSFVSVSLPQGSHTIHLEYRQRGLIPGIVVSVIAALALGYLLFRKNHSIMTSKYGMNGFDGE